MLRLCQLPMGLLMACFAVGAPGSSHLAKRAPNYNVLGGRNFPDPGIINVQGTSYVFGTVDGIDKNIPLTTNANYNNAAGWLNPPTEAFPQTNVPAVGPKGWALPFTSWAPDVKKLTDFDGSYAMYYAPQVKGADPAIHCISLARSLDVAGPYNDSSTKPLICPRAKGGAIDAAGFLDTDGSRWIVYKIDGPAVTGGGYCNSPSNPPSNTPLMLQKVKSDGYTLVGDPVEIYNNQGVSDQYNVEAPSLYKSDAGIYFLFFSAGCTSDNTYRTDYVTSTTICGGYGNRKTLIKTGDFGQFGPGGADISNKLQMVYHSLRKSNNITSGRVLNTAKLSISGKTAKVL